MAHTDDDEVPRAAWLDTTITSERSADDDGRMVFTDHRLWGVGTPDFIVRFAYLSNPERALWACMQFLRANGYEPNEDERLWPTSRMMSPGFKRTRYSAGKAAAEVIVTNRALRERLAALQAHYGDKVEDSFKDFYRAQEELDSAQAAIEGVS